MTNLIPPDEVEQLVGAKRHPTKHIGRADHEERMIYILHSQECVDTNLDLRECKFSVALDRRVDGDCWPSGPQELFIHGGFLDYD